MECIKESYFGAVILPIEILETKFSKIYVGLIIKVNGDMYNVFYNEDGNDPMELSSIDTDEFIRVLENNKGKQ